MTDVQPNAPTGWDAAYRPAPPVGDNPQVWCMLTGSLRRLADGCMPDCLHTCRPANVYRTETWPNPTHRED